MRETEGEQGRVSPYSLEFWAFAGGVIGRCRCGSDTRLARPERGSELVKGQVYNFTTGRQYKPRHPPPWHDLGHATTPRKPASI
jgi:hypothetical protein